MLAEAMLMHPAVELFDIFEGEVMSVGKNTYRVKREGYEPFTVYKEDLKPYQRNHSCYGILKEEIPIYNKYVELELVKFNTEKKKRLKNVIKGEIEEYKKHKLTKEEIQEIFTDVINEW